MGTFTYVPQVRKKNIRVLYVEQIYSGFYMYTDAYFRPSAVTVGWIHNRRINCVVAIQLKSPNIIQCSISRSTLYARVMHKNLSQSQNDNQTQRYIVDYLYYRLHQYTSNSEFSRTILRVYNASLFTYKSQTTMTTAAAATTTVMYVDM